MNIKSPIQIAYKICLCLVRGFPIRAAIFCDIPIAKLPRSTIIAHPFGIVIGDETVFGENCIIRQNVTIGRRAGRRMNELGHVTIGNDVDLGAGAIILGELTIRDNCLIGAGAIVLKSVPPNTTVVGVYK